MSATPKVCIDLVWVLGCVFVVKYALVLMRCPYEEIENGQDGYPDEYDVIRGKVNVF